MIKNISGNVNGFYEDFTFENSLEKLAEGNPNYLENRLLGTEFTTPSGETLSCNVFALQTVRPTLFRTTPNPGYPETPTYPQKPGLVTILPEGEVHRMLVCLGFEGTTPIVSKVIRKITEEGTETSVNIEYTTTGNAGFTATVTLVVDGSVKDIINIDREATLTLAAELASTLRGGFPANPLYLENEQPVFDQDGLTMLQQIRNKDVVEEIFNKYK